jgi:hypothetical protein
MVVKLIAAEAFSAIHRGVRRSDEGVAKCLAIAGCGVVETGAGGADARTRTRMANGKAMLTSTRSPINQPLPKQGVRIWPVTRLRTAQPRWPPRSCTARIRSCGRTRCMPRRSRRRRIRSARVADPGAPDVPGRRRHYTPPRKRPTVRASASAMSTATFPLSHRPRLSRSSRPQPWKSTGPLAIRVTKSVLNAAAHSVNRGHSGRPLRASRQTDRAKTSQSTEVGTAERTVAHGAPRRRGSAPARARYGRPFGS